MSLIRFAGGRLSDPASGLTSDRCQDVYSRDGRLAYPADEHQAAVWQQQAEQTIACDDCVIMAGGIDLHTHIGGGKLTLARLLLPEYRDSGFLPPASETGNAYRRMGYSTAVEPAMLACNARQTHAEMADTPHLDTAAYVLLGNERMLLQMLADNVPQSLVNDYVAWTVTATQAIGVKVVNPGGIDAFKFNGRQMDVDTPHPIYGITPRQVIRSLARAVWELGIPHPLHVHCSNLGVPGNIDSTLATIAAAEGLPIHLAHAQFHSYSGGEGQRFGTAAARLAAALAQNPNVTIDVGQVMFGQTVTISGDTMHQYDNVRWAQPRKSVLVDVECQAGCGVVPFRYRNRQFVHALQWAIGLELFLMVDDPARVFLTTDHPNGGPFTSYPHLIRLLMDHSYRDTALAEIDADASAASDLRGLNRQYSLDEIATMTRSAPAQLLGLADRGTLAAGAAADLVVYRQQADWQAMFAQPHGLFRHGQWSSGGDWQNASPTTAASEPKLTHTVRPSFDPASIERLRSYHDRHASYRWQRLWISDDELATVIGSQPVVHPCRQAKSPPGNDQSRGGQNRGGRS